MLFPALFNDVYRFKEELSYELEGIAEVKEEEEEEEAAYYSGLAETKERAYCSMYFLYIRLIFVHE